MFLDRKGKYKNYTKISKGLFMATIVMMFLAIILNIVVGGNVERYIVFIGLALFICGLIVEMIPDFLEKDKTKIILNSVLILCIVIAWFVILK